jgi:hypothetical protein
MDNRLYLYSGMAFRLIDLAIRYRTRLFLPFFVHSLVSQVNGFSHVLGSVFSLANMTYSSCHHLLFLLDVWNDLIKKIPKVLHKKATKEMSS